MVEGRYLNPKSDLGFGRGRRWVGEINESEKWEEKVEIPYWKRFQGLHVTFPTT